MEKGTFSIPNFNDRWDKDLKFTLSMDTEQEGILHVFLKGRIDTYNSEFFQSRLSCIFDEGIVKLIFRCSSLEFISSSGLGVLVNERDRFIKAGGNFVFMDLHPKVHEVFQLLGFTHLFNIANDLSEAHYFLSEAAMRTKNVFPLAFNCPNCDKKLATKKAGRFRCSNCKVAITVSEEGFIGL